MLDTIGLTWDILLGLAISVAIVLFIMTNGLKKRNLHDAYLSKDEMENSPFDVDMYYAENEIPLTESKLYADDTYELLKKDRDYSEARETAIDSKSRKLVQCYVPGLEEDSEPIVTPNLNDDDPFGDRAPAPPARDYGKASARNNLVPSAPWIATQTKPVSRAEEPEKGGPEVDSDAPAVAQAPLAAPYKMPEKETPDDGLDDMARRLAPKKSFEEANPIYDLPTASRPIWEQSGNDDFSDLDDMM